MLGNCKIQNICIIINLKVVPKDKHTGTSLVSTLAAITTSATVKMLGSY